MYRVHFVIIFFSVAVGVSASAQVIGEASSADVRQNFRELSLRSFEVGLSPGGNFSPLASNTFATPFNVSRVLLSAILRQDNTLLYFDYSVGNIDGFPEAVTFGSGGAKFDVDIAFGPPAPNVLRPIIPLSVVADLLFVSTRQERGSDNISLGSLGIGAGVGLAYNTRASLFVAKAEAFIAFGTQGFSPVTGLVSGVITDATFHLPQFFGAFGIAFTYRFRYTTSSFSTTQYNYLFRAHTLTAGITF